MRSCTCRVVLSALLLACLAVAGAPQDDTTTATQDKVVKVLRTSNKAQTNRYVCDVYDFKNVNPYAIVNYFASGLIREEGGIYSFVAPDGASGKILVICPEYQLESYAQMAKQLDVKDLTSAPGSAYKYLQLSHRSSVDALFLDVLAQYTSPNSTVVGDVETNSVFIWDSHSGANYAEAALKSVLDVPTQSVDIEVKIYEISATNDGRLGLDYEAWKNGPGRDLFTLSAEGSYFRHWDPDFRNTRTAYGSELLIDYPSEFFDFLVEKGRAKALTRAELAAMHDQSASLFAGDTILYFQETFPAGERMVEQKAYTSSAVQGTPTGVGLTILPTVGSEVVNLELNISVVNHLGYAEDGAPKVGNRTLKQEIRAIDGQEVMLGGISRTRTIREVQKVPILGSIPVLGYFFGGETESVSNSTIVIALRPKIKDSQKNFTDDHKKVIDQVTGQAALVVPDTPVGFDQWLME